MLVALSAVDLRIPGCTSLKEKRHVVKSLQAGLRQKFNVAVAEVDHQDLWQRASIGVTCISESGFHARKMLKEIERFVSHDGRVEIIDSATEVHAWSDFDGD